MHIHAHALTSHLKSWNEWKNAAKGNEYNRLLLNYLINENTQFNEL